MAEKTILLVEDDFLNRRLTKKVLAENNYQVLEAKNTKEALALLTSEAIDFIILDINLGTQERDGIYLGQEIKEKFLLPFAYLTAYEDISIMTKAVATTPSSYITKPFKNTDLVAAIELGIRQFAAQQRPKPTIVVKEDTFYTELVIDDICYIESDKNYVLLYTENKVFKTRSTIKQILDQLPADDFIQIHRAFVVNKNKIDKFTLKSLVINHQEIPISRNFIQGLTKFYQ